MTNFVTPSVHSSKIVSLTDPFIFYSAWTGKERGSGKSLQNFLCHSLGTVYFHILLYVEVCLPECSNLLHAFKDQLLSVTVLWDMVGLCSSANGFDTTMNTTAA